MHSVPYAKETLVMLLGYALGCFTSGYYLVRWRTGDDIRWLGSGSVGATNVGRVLGRPGFFLTVLCDFFKGVFAVWLARYFQLNPTGTVLTMVAVAIGHIWPAQLWFHGGRGDRKSTRLNSSHPSISYAVFCLKKKKASKIGIR